MKRAITLSGAGGTNCQFLSSIISITIRSAFFVVERHMMTFACLYRWNLNYVESCLICNYTLSPLFFLNDDFDVSIVEFSISEI